MVKQYLPSGEACRVSFFLPLAAAGEGADVRLLGEINHWDWDRGVPLQRTTDGYRTELELAGGRDYEFRFLIDNNRWENQWDADAYVPTPFGVDNFVVSLARDAGAPAFSLESASAPRAAHADDLTKVEGIGPAIAVVLNRAGIQTFAQLAESTASEIEEVLAAAGARFKVHDPASWPEQARLAASGDWPALFAYQDRLVGGRIA